MAAKFEGLAELHERCVIQSWISQTLWSICISAKIEDAVKVPVGKFVISRFLRTHKGLWFTLKVSNVGVNESCTERTPTIQNFEITLMFISIS